MSGGSHNYLYSRLAESLGIPSGHYGIQDNIWYDDELSDVRRTNPMHDTELSELMYDVSCLLHSLEWYSSGDTGEECYRKDCDTFKRKWFLRDSKQTIDAYRQDVNNFLRSIAV